MTEARGLRTLSVESACERNEGDGEEHQSRRGEHAKVRPGEDTDVDLRTRNQLSR